MRELFTIRDAKNMSTKELKARLTKCREELESLGMEHDDACIFLSEVMNIGIGVQTNQNWVNSQSAF